MGAATLFTYLIAIMRIIGLAVRLILPHLLFGLVVYCTVCIDYLDCLHTLHLSHFFLSCYITKKIIFAEATVLYAINGKHVSLAKLLYGYRLSPDNSQEISTKTEGKKFFKLKPNEIVLQVGSVLSNDQSFVLNTIFISLIISSFYAGSMARNLKRPCCWYTDKSKSTDHYC